MAKLTRREKFLLRLLYPDGSMAIGLTAGAVLLEHGYVMRRRDRYVLTRKGLIAAAAQIARASRSAPIAPAQN